MFSITNITNLLLCVFLTTVYSQRESAEKQTHADLCSGNTDELKYVIVPNTQCMLFVMCSGDRVHDRLQCSPKTRFNLELKYCDHEYNVPCVETSESFPEGPDCRMRAVPGFCQNFTECSNGELVMKSCGEGSIFSNKDLDCYRPEDLPEEDKPYCNIPI